MNICAGSSCRHEEIVVEDKYNCPLCEALLKIRELEDEIKEKDKIIEALEDKQ